jgi:hypothetical protein
VGGGVVEVGDLGAGVVAELEATAMPVLRQSLSLSASTVVCDRRHFGFRERWGEEGEWIQSNPSDNVLAARRGCLQSP